MSTAELEINILNMFDKLKISPYLYAIEVTDDRDKWVELCDLYNNIKGISKILTLTTEDTKNLWTFIDRFLSIAPGIYKRPKNTSKIPLLMKLYLDRECDLFDNVNSSTIALSLFSFCRLLANSVSTISNALYSL